MLSQVYLQHHHPVYTRTVRGIIQHYSHVNRINTKLRGVNCIRHKLSCAVYTNIQRTNMNSIVLFIAVAVLVTVQAHDDHDHKEEFKQLEAECEKETGVDFDLITRAEKGEFEEGNDLKCFPKCFFEKAKFMSADGKIDEAAMKAAAEEKGDADVRVPIVEKCIKKVGKDACETAYLVFRCYWEEVKAAGLKK